MGRRAVVAGLGGALGALAAGCSLLTSYDGLVCGADCGDASVGPGVDGGRLDAGADVSGGAGRDAPPDSPLDSPADTSVADVSTPVDSGGGDDSGADASIPITFVQVNHTAPAAATATLSFNNPVGQGDAILVAFIGNASATLDTIADSLGNSFPVVVGPDPGSGNNHYIAIALDSPGGADTITVTFSAVPGGANLFILEYSGLVAANAFDVTKTGSGTSTATDGMQSGFATTTAPVELIFGLADASGGSAGTGFASRDVLKGNVVEDEIVTSAGSYQATATASSGSWTMVMATFIGQ
jgi:hypothetical protein